MEMIINRETVWHDGPNAIVVPDGVIVWREILNCVPPSELRWMKQSIEHKKRFFGLKFVPIKIRGWWAIINSTWLSPVDGARPAAAPVKKSKKLEMASSR
jgi:hypothetical protein